jgi:flagellar protein FlaG
MNTISTIGPVMAMDGRSFSNTVSAVHGNPAAKQVPTTLPTTAAEVSKTLAENLAETKETVREIQKLSDIVLGHKLQFNVNHDLGIVVVEVVDPATNQVIREIPSEDLQRIQVQMKQAIGVLFDEMI